MSIVLIADGVLNIEGEVKASTASALYGAHQLDRDLAEDSMIEEGVLLKKALGKPLVLLSMAPAPFEKEMRVYMAAGCDRALRVESDFGQCLDLAAKSHCLSRILQTHVPDWQVILTIDRTPGGAAGVLHHYLAEVLGSPSFSSVSQVHGDAEGVEVVTRSEGVIHRYRAHKPVVLGVTSRRALHSPSFMEVHRARKMPIEYVDVREDVLHDIGSAAGRSRTAVYTGARTPPASSSRATAAQKLGADETASRLAEICRQARSH